MSPDYLGILDLDLGAMLGVDFKADGQEVTDAVSQRADGSARVLRPELSAR